MSGTTVRSWLDIHYDAEPFRDPAALASLIRAFTHWREPLRDRLGTNPRCRRIAPLPEPLVAAVQGTPTLEQLQLAARESGLSKFYDLNLANLLCPNPIRDTVEIRILPGGLDAADVVDEPTSSNACSIAASTGRRSSRRTP